MALRLRSAWPGLYTQDTVSVIQQHSQVRAQVTMANDMADRHKTISTSTVTKSKLMLGEEYAINTK